MAALSALVVLLAAAAGTAARATEVQGSPPPAEAEKSGWRQYPPKTPTPLASRFDEVFAWKYVDYAFPSDEERQSLVHEQRYIPHRCMPVGFELWRDKVFITTPRRKAGVPVVLGYIRAKDKERSPKVIPYPDYETNQLPGKDGPNEGDPVRIASAYRIRVDACDRLWVIDAGKADAGHGHVLWSKPQILVFDLTTDKLVRHFVLREEHYYPTSFFATINVEVSKEHCDQAFAYAADLGAPEMLVYSFQDDDAWRINHAFFHADPLATNYDLDGLQFQLVDGLIAATPGERQQDGFSTLYFHALSSFSEFGVSTRTLRSKTPQRNSHLEFKHLGSRGPTSQSSASFYHPKTGVLFFTEVPNHAVTCWNTRTHPRPEGAVDVVAVDNSTRGFIYPCDIKVDDADSLWVLSNNIPGYIFRDLDPKQFNHFIYKTTVKTALQGTKCEGGQGDGGHYHHRNPGHRPAPICCSHSGPVVYPNK